MLRGQGGGVLGDREAGLGARRGTGEAEREGRGEKSGRRHEGRGRTNSDAPRVLCGVRHGPLAGESARWARAGQSCTRGVGEPEGDGLVRDAAHVAYRHLAGVAGIVLGPQVLQLQDLGLPLGQQYTTGVSGLLGSPGTPDTFTQHQRPKQSPIFNPSFQPPSAWFIPRKPEPGADTVLSIP